MNVASRKEDRLFQSYARIHAKATRLKLRSKYVLDLVPNTCNAADWRAAIAATMVVDVVFGNFEVKKQGGFIGISNGGRTIRRLVEDRL